MIYTEFRDRLALHLADMMETHDRIFEVDYDKEAIFECYEESFPSGTNPIFRKRRNHDCSTCRHFIQTIGGAVFIDDDLSVHTIWEFEKDDPTYGPVATAMDSYVRSLPIRGIFISRFKLVGVESNLDNELDIRWNHYYAEIPQKFVFDGRDTIDGQKAAYRDSVATFCRSLEEISSDAIDTVLELIASNSLYKGEEWKGVLTAFRQYKQQYEQLSGGQRTLYGWLMAGRVGGTITRMRTVSMGKLLMDVSEGVELDSAVRSYELIVAPSNYKRPKPIYTEKMLEEARETMERLGYMESLPRRYATLDDIRVNNILFSNKDSAKRILGDVFDDLRASAKTPPKKFDRVEEIPVEKFISDVLPSARELEAYVENRHAPNFMSVIAPKNPDAPTMFKWNNAFSWAYAGNITDSDVKQNVKNVGGRVDGELRFSIQWNDTDEFSKNDLDAHCVLPSGEEIYYRHKLARDGGNLDVDIIHPEKSVPAVENITWPDRTRMRPGKYSFFVHQFSNRGGRDGFRAEIEFDGQIYKFDYRRELRQDEKVPVAEITLSSRGEFSIKTNLPSENTSREIWGVKTLSFVPVSLVMHSPNYWDEQSGIGNKHYFFILKGCINEESPNGFYNEYLKQELNEHRRVLEALGSKMKVEPSSDQLSGIGFSSTKRNELIVKVKGATERIMKIKF